MKTMIITTKLRIKVAEKKIKEISLKMVRKNGLIGAGALDDYYEICYWEETLERLKDELDNRES